MAPPYAPTFVEAHPLFIPSPYNFNSSSHIHTSSFNSVELVYALNSRKSLITVLDLVSYHEINKLYSKLLLIPYGLVVRCLIRGQISI